MTPGRYATPLAFKTAVEARLRREAAGPTANLHRAHLRRSGLKLSRPTVARFSRRHRDT
jgi:hypothetical protein